MSLELNNVHVTSDAPFSIEAGGTGADNAEDARANLGIGLGVGGIPPTTLGLGTTAALDFDPDGNLAANSDDLLPTQRATKSYVDGANTFNLKFLGYINCSTNPNYPAAFKSDLYAVSFAGRIGGASGKIVEVGDVFFATSDNAGGAEGSVGFAWTVLQHGDRYITGSTGATDNALIRADGTGGTTVQASSAVVDDDGILTLTPASPGPALVIADGFSLNSAGSGNIAIGDLALQGSTVTGNVAIGGSVLRNTTYSDNNTAIGTGAMQDAPYSSGNTAVGPNAMRETHDSQENAVLGDSALRGAHNCSSNLAMGSSAMQNASYAYSNIALGESALNTITNGSSNSAVGNAALDGAQNSNYNSAFGARSLSGANYSSYNAAVGSSALYGTAYGNYNLAFGNNALRGARYCNNNLALGSGSGDQNITGSYNTLVGANTVVDDPDADNQVNLANVIQVDSSGVVITPSIYKPSYGVSAYAAGTPYTLTNTAAAIAFGTTNPVVTLAQKGTYRVSGFAVLENVNATFAANQTATLKLRRTNNTAADLTSGAVVHTFQIIAAGFTQTAAVLYWEAGDYTTTNTNDSLTVFAALSAAPGAGSVRISQAFIKATRVA